MAPDLVSTVSTRVHGPADMSVQGEGLPLDTGHGTTDSLVLAPAGLPGSTAYSSRPASPSTSSTRRSSRTGPAGGGPCPVPDVTMIPTEDL